MKVAKADLDLLLNDESREILLQPPECEWMTHKSRTCTKDIEVLSRTSPSVRVNLP